MAALDNIASELLKSANEADLNYKKTRDQAQRDKAVRLRRIVENLRNLSSGTSTLDQVTTAGNTTANTINVGGITTDYVQLDTAATPTPVQGMMFWDSDRSTVDVQLDADVSAKVGQDNFWYVKNQSGATIPKGKAVMAVGTLGSSGRILIDEMVANGTISSKFLLGITAEDIANGADGFVMNIGKLRQVNTSVWPDGTVLYCDPTTAGNLTSTKPSSPNLALPVAFVVHSAANGVLAIRVSILDENAFNTPTLAQVTTAGNTTTNAITVGGLTVGQVGGSGVINFPTTISGHLIQIYTQYASNQIVIQAGSRTFLLNGAGQLITNFNTTITGSTGSAALIVQQGNAAWSPVADFNGSAGTALRVNTNGNILIGTTTDAGYKLDVNGTARIVNKTNIGSETVSQGSLYIGHNGTAGGSNGTSTVFFVSQFGNYPYRLGAENNGYDFYLRQANGGQGSINIDFSGLNSISYNITNTNVLNQAFGKSAIIDAKTTLNSYLAIGTRFGYSDSLTAGDSPLIFFRSMDGSYYNKTLDAAVTIRNGLPTVADNNITKNTAYWYRNGYIGIGTSTTLSATNTLKGAITINQGTTIGYQNLNPGSLSSVITSGTSATVTFTPNNGNGVPGYDIIVGTIITANGVSRRVTAVNYQTVTVDSAVDWSAGYNYTYRNPYVSIADGSTPIFDILPSGNVAVGTTTAVAKFTVAGSITAASALAQGVYFNNTLVAAANNDVLVGLDINPTFTNGAFTGVDNWDLRTRGKVLVSSTSTGNVFPLVVRSTNYPGILLQNGSTGTNHSAAPYDGFAFWINYDVSHAKGLITNYENNGISIYNGTNPATGVTIFGSTNNVAINSTTDAGYKLDVNGTARVATSLNVSTAGSGTMNTYLGGSVAIGNDFVNNGYILQIKSINTGIAGIYLRAGGAGGYPILFCQDANGTASTTFIVRETGNVGIGTTTPTDKFHIVDNTNGNKFARISAGGTDASAAWVAQNDQVDNVVYRVFGSAVTGSQMGQALARSASLIVNLGGTGKFLIGSYSSTDLIFGTGDQARMRLVDSTGNFLIGTMTDTGNKLTVSGNIDAQGYKVNNVLGFTGIFNVPTNPPGQQNIDIQSGIVVNIF